ncbi:MAG: ABC transporter permease [Pseudomonadales bacterium]|nr:ABC transporter permease [Candidatus Woesebacteria bacterium]MCB9801052.1 ABC transporter permease [Pseudomonadales bacterium]
MKLHRIKALCYRHLYPLRRDFDLLSDMIYWPLIDTLLWGVTGQWLSSASEDPGSAQLLIVSILLGLIFWNVIWRSQAEVSRNLMDEIWNNNLINLFSTPLRVDEWVTSVLLLSVIKTAITMILLVPAIFFLYTVNVFELGWWIPVFFLSTTMTGWWLGFISAGIVLRYGPKAQTVIWTLPGILLPFSAIYFPLSQLPAVIQPISRMIPTTYIFESMRALIQGGEVDPLYLTVSFALNIAFLSFAFWFFVKSFRYSTKLGLGRFN